MLDLEPGVHFDERELPVLIQELQGPSVAVSEFAERGGRRVAPSASRSSPVITGRSRLLQKLLVPPLQAAIAFAEMHDVTRIVGEDLQFDVPGPVEVFFHIHGVVTERGLRLAARDPPCFFELVRVLGQPSCRARRPPPPL